MTNSTNSGIPAETDDARSVDTPEADQRREALEKETRKGFRKAVEEVKNSAPTSLEGI